MEKPGYFLIDSKDRVSGTSSNFRMQMYPGLQNIKSVKLLGISLPLTNYIINTLNNNIYFRVGVTDYVATITPGVYDYSTILSAIKTSMEATGFGGIVTVIYSDSTLKFTIASTVSFLFTWGEFTDNSSAYILGWTNENSLDDVSHESPDVSHLSVPPYLLIDIDKFPIICTTTNKESCSFIVFSQHNSGYIAFHWANTHYMLQSQGTVQPLQDFQVKIKYRGDNILDLNEVDWSMLIEVEY
jgi:hypothetical protein